MNGHTRPPLGGAPAVKYRGRSCMAGSGKRTKAGLFGSAARLALPGALAVGLVAGLPGEALAFKLFGYGFFEGEEKPVSPDAQTYSIEVTVATPDKDLASSLRG